MANIEIYTWQSCPFCLRAKALLEKKGLAYVEHRIDGDQTARAAMSKRAEGRTTVPQIFINGQSIGGCDELYALDQSHKLDNLLSA